MRISNFEKARIRLKKLLMYDLDTMSKIENTTKNFIKADHIPLNPIEEECIKDDGTDKLTEELKKGGGKGKTNENILPGIYQDEYRYVLTA
jgi:hypothetical protein